MQRQLPIQMWMHVHGATGLGGAPARGLDLQVKMVKAHGVVAIHGTPPLQRENAVQMGSPTGCKSAPAGCGGTLIRRLNSDRVVLARKAMGRLQGGASRRRNSCGRRPCRWISCVHWVPAPAASRPGSSGFPTRATPVPPWIKRLGSTASPAFGVSQKWLPRSLYKAQKMPSIRRGMIFYTKIAMERAMTVQEVIFASPTTVSMFRPWR
jgi:hypothetical protein